MWYFDSKKDNFLSKASTWPFAGPWAFACNFPRASSLSQEAIFAKSFILMVMPHSECPISVLLSPEAIYTGVKPSGDTGP